jgi:hypothetical protein
MLGENKGRKKKEKSCERRGKERTHAASNQKVPNDASTPALHKKTLQ